jgi:hypothetical protein
VGNHRFPSRRGSGPKATALNVVPRLPQVLPAKVAAAEFALVFAVMARAVVAAAFRVAVIDARVKAETCCVAVLLVPHCAKRHALVFARLLFAQNRVVFFAADVGALKPHERVVFRPVNDHCCNQIVYILCIYMIFFEWDGIVHLVGHFK